MNMDQGTVNVIEHVTGNNVYECEPDTPDC